MFRQEMQKQNLQEFMENLSSTPCSSFVFRASLGRERSWLSPLFICSSIILFFYYPFPLLLHHLISEARHIGFALSLIFSFAIDMSCKREIFKVVLLHYMSSKFQLSLS